MSSPVHADDDDEVEEVEFVSVSQQVQRVTLSVNVTVAYFLSADIDWIDSFNFYLFR